MAAKTWPILYAVVMITEDQNSYIFCTSREFNDAIIMTADETLAARHAARLNAITSSNNYQVYKLSPHYEWVK